MREFHATFTRYENGTRFISAPARFLADDFRGAFELATIFLSGMNSRVGEDFHKAEILSLVDNGIHPPACVVSTNIHDIWEDPRPTEKEEEA